jgi:estrone sulfotransferase
VSKKVLRLCSFGKLSGLPPNRVGEINQVGNIDFDKSVFFRKGIAGDWVNHITEEMGRKTDCIMEEKLKGSGLEF